MSHFILQVVGGSDEWTLPVVVVPDMVDVGGELQPGITAFEEDLPASLFALLQRDEFPFHSAEEFLDCLTYQVNEGAGHLVAHGETLGAMSGASVLVAWRFVP